MLIANKVMSKMYLLTILAIWGIVMYRQFVLGQDISDFEDLAILMTINSIFLISALLYFGAIPLRKLRIKSILLIYLLFIILGFLFTYTKYNILQSPGLSMEQLFAKLMIIFTITGLLILFYILFSVLGKRKIDRELK